MHVQIFDVVLVWLFVIMSAESSEPFVAQVGLHRVHSADEHVQPAVELLLVQDQRVVDVPLN